LKATLALIIWCLFIAVASLMPLGSDSIDLIPYQDKWIHWFCYTVLAYLGGKSLGSGRFQNNKWLLLTVLIGASAYGFVIECLQGLFNTGRHFDYFDIIANIIGSMMGSLIYYLKRQKGFL